MMKIFYSYRMNFFKKTANGTSIVSFPARSIILFLYFACSQNVYSFALGALITE